MKASKKSPIKAKIINGLLLITFLLTMAVPFTGVIVHKLAATAFLLLCLIHTIMYRKCLNGRKYAVLGLVAAAFVSGIFSLIYEELPWILAVHKVVSIAVVALLAIHVYTFYRKFR